jgi:hypothetical protein
MIVHSSHGDFTINENGEVIDLKLDTDCPDTERHFKSITKFDLNEYKEYYGQLESEYDILDLGYWHTKYEKPDLDWRKRIAKGYFNDCKSN